VGQAGILNINSTLQGLITGYFVFPSEKSHLKHFKYSLSAAKDRKIQSLNLSTLEGLKISSAH
jgi:hypothetical protein